MNKRRLIFTALIMFIQLSANEYFSLSAYPWMKISYTGEANVINRFCSVLPADDPFYHESGDSANFIRVMDYVPDEQNGQLYNILFSMGESADSRYIFYKAGEYHEPAFVIHTDHLHFRGRGEIIATGSVNEMFTISRKYKLKRGKIRELRQPFYAVDVRSRAVKDFDIYQSRRLRNNVTKIHQGEKLTVLAAEFDKRYEYYLIRSDTGLCGWIRIEPGTWVDETPIQDLYYHGD